MERSLTVAIPALNEEDNIEAAVRAARAAGDKVPGLRLEILVIDDGSTDRTAEIVRGLERSVSGVRLLQNPENLGLGVSMRRAIGEAGCERFIFIPGDNDIPAETLDLLFGNAYAADIVMCYFDNDESRGRLRYLISTGFKLVYTTVFDLYVHYINGPAVYPVEKLRELELRATRFSIVAEINVKLLRQGVSFVELPANRQTGMHGSTSMSWRSLAETGPVFFHILAEVFWRDRARYAHRPRRLHYRIHLEPAVPPANTEH